MENKRQKSCEPGNGKWEINVRIRFWGWVGMGILPVFVRVVHLVGVDFRTRSRNKNGIGILKGVTFFGSLKGWKSARAN